MLDITATHPTYFWTYDRISSHQEWEDGDQVWIADQIARPEISEKSIAFDIPAHWEYDFKRIVFLCNEEGIWAWRGAGDIFEGVRSETATHLLLTGIWKQPDLRGAFVVVIPKATEFEH